MTEVAQLEDTLKKADAERNEMQKALSDVQKLMLEAQQQHSEQKRRADQLTSYISSLSTLREASCNCLPNDLEVSFDESTMKEVDDEGDADCRVLLQLRNTLHLKEKKYKTALSEIGSLQDEMAHLRNAAALGTETTEFGDALSDLASKCLLCEEAVSGQAREIKALVDEVGRGDASISVTQAELMRVVEDLAQLYHLVCGVSGETPSRIMLHHAKLFAGSHDSKDAHKSGDLLDPTTVQSSLLRCVDSGVSHKDETPKGELCVSGGTEDVTHDPTSCEELSATVADQVRFLKMSVEKLLETSSKKQRGRDSTGNVMDDLSESQGQVVKLKAMLSTKREQIATLRSVLKANKSTAETALTILKQKYENEKVIVTGTMLKLRRELRSLKEDATAFASLRAMFAQRCDEYVTQLGECHQNISAAEEEKKTLNSLLRMAIQQKLALNQRLDDLEFDRERRSMARIPSVKGSSRMSSSKVSDNSSSMSSSERYRGHSRRVFANFRRDY